MTDREEKKVLSNLGNLKINLPRLESETTKHHINLD
jgi:hypothetical protein